MVNPENISQFVDATEKLLPKQELYNDAFKPLAQEVGKALGTAGETINLALKPLRGLIWGADQITNYLKPKLEEKLKHIPQDKIITPDPLIAGPIFQNIRFAENHEHIKEMYVNLLANAMNKDTTENSLPCFIEIIKQMSPLDAKLFNYLYPNINHAIVNANIDLGNSRLATYRNLILKPFSEYEDTQLSTSIESLSRFGLIEICFDSYNLSDDTKYKKLEKYVSDAIQTLYDLDAKLNMDKGYLLISHTGRAFSSICCSPECT